MIRPSGSSGISTTGVRSASKSAQPNRIASGAASHQLLIATALRDRLPCVGRVFAEGLITYRLVSSIVWRTMLIKDSDALRAVDAALALAIREWEPMSAGKTVAAIDHWVERVDAHALRRSQEASRSRSVHIGTADGRGLDSLWGMLFAHHAAALGCCCPRCAFPPRRLSRLAFNRSPTPA
jgi:hypothetical protein